MKGTAKLSIEAWAVLDSEKNRLQYTVNVKIRNRIERTLQIVVKSGEDPAIAISNFLADALGEQLEKQRAYHFIDWRWGIQEELPF